MDVYKLVACLLIWSISASTQSASQSSSEVLQNTEVNSVSILGVQVFKPQVKAGRYWVQVLATNITPSTERYMRLFSADSVVVHKDRDNINRVMVGPLKTFAGAIRAQQRAHENGLNDAFLRFSELPYEVISSRYWVQLYATKNPVNYSSIMPLRSFSRIKIIGNDNGYNRVLAGPFGSYKEAEAIRLQSKDRGMDGTFILTLSDNPF
jgi:hypothetical protein